MSNFEPFPKVPRLNRKVVITEKIDGTNASVWITNSDELDHPDPSVVSIVDTNTGPMMIRAGSRKRFVTPNSADNKQADNFGFAAWVRDNAEELVKLGEGVHYGEWWSKGIQRGYGLNHRRFSLFNTARWANVHNNNNGKGMYSTKQQLAPECCHVVPTLGNASTITAPYIKVLYEDLENTGSVATGYNGAKAEGIMLYHTAANQMFKMTYEYDETGKDN